MNNNVLIVAAHPDDEVLGCGGTIAKHVEEKYTVTIIFICDGETSRSKKIQNLKARNESAEKVSELLGCQKPIFFNFPDNKLDSIIFLEIVQKLESYIIKIKPNIIYTHHYNDLNIDHQLTCKSLITACRPLPKSFVKSIYLFEIPSSTEWSISNDKFSPNKFIDITSYKSKKDKALDLYKEEMRDFPHPRSKKAISAIENLRGVISNVEFAEAFQIYRQIL